ncbi:MAG TPA: 2OG-Fe(II) oxygenase [Flavobacteriales bacterium]
MEEFLNHFEQHGFYVFDSFIDDVSTRGVLAELIQLREADEFKKAGIGREDNFQINHNERGDFIRWIDRNDVAPNTARFLEKLDEVILHLNRNFFLGVRDYECHYTQYPIGTFYKKHVDRHKTGSARIVSFVFYLNEGWTEADGGQLRIFGKDTYTDVLPAFGRLAMFLSEKEHEVLPTQRVRNSITGWMLNEVRI